MEAQIERTTFFRHMKWEYLRGIQGDGWWGPEAPPPWDTSADGLSRWASCKNCINKNIEAPRHSYAVRQWIAKHYLPSRGCHQQLLGIHLQSFMLLGHVQRRVSFHVRRLRDLLAGLGTMAAQQKIFRKYSIMKSFKSTNQKLFLYSNNSMLKPKLTLSD